MYPNRRVWRWWSWPVWEFSAAAGGPRPKGDGIFCAPLPDNRRSAPYDIDLNGASMSDHNARIEQFRKMAEADPGNELGHFSLGKAYLDAGMTAPAVQAFQRALELNPNIAKVYQLLADALLKENRKLEAIERLTRGVEVAASRGDMMPQNEMAKMLKDLGAPVPAVAAAPPATSQPVGEGQVSCNRCGRIARKMASPPFSNAQGKLIF